VVDLAAAGRLLASAIIAVVQMMTPLVDDASQYPKMIFPMVDDGRSWKDHLWISLINT
jgi:hypothetical protein